MVLSALSISQRCDRYLSDHTYDPDDSETLLAAFRVLLLVCCDLSANAGSQALQCGIDRCWTHRGTVTSIPT